MKKLKLAVLLLIVLTSKIKASQVSQLNDLQVCLTKCRSVKKICHNQATLTLARVNACKAVDTNFDLKYDCTRACRQNPRTMRFNSVK